MKIMKFNCFVCNEKCKYSSITYDLTFAKVLEWQKVLPVGCYLCERCSEAFRQLVQNYIFVLSTAIPQLTETNLNNWGKLFDINRIEGETYKKFSKRLQDHLLEKNKFLKNNKP